MQQRNIQLIGVKQNNLKNISAEFPARKITVITGLSGSGKSSLAFDTLYAEGQRRYIESLSTYTRQFLEKMPKPTVDTVINIPPAIALEQKNHVNNSRSTVGTQTEIIDYLRILYARIGKTSCINCNGEVKKLDPQLIVDWAIKWLPNKKAIIAAPLHSDASNEQDKTSKAPKHKKDKKEKKASSTVFELLREQGFQRVLIRSAKKIEVFETEEFHTKEPPKGEIFVVVDRLRVTQKIDSDTQSRVLDSIEQASRIGKGSVVFYDMETEEWKDFTSDFSCVQCGTRHKIPEPNLFSFNSPIGACSRCSGFGYTLDLDESLVIPDPSKTLKNGAVDPFSKPSLTDWQDDLWRFAERHGISIGKRYRELTASERNLIWNGDTKDKTFPGIFACFEELKRWKYKLHIRVFIRRYQSQSLCPECQGARLAKEALAVKIGDQTIANILQLPILDALEWFETLRLSPKEKKISDEAFSQIKRRLHLLCEVGVGYLTLSRLAKTLSGGEFQRINLATQLGNGLCGTLYVLDEPSIGLHAADTEKLIQVLRKLRDQGNTVVVVEHDLEIIRSADWLI
jgi:excinuclease ABC subunit A